MAKVAAADALTALLGALYGCGRKGSNTAPTTPVVVTGQPATTQASSSSPVSANSDPASLPYPVLIARSMESLRIKTGVQDRLIGLGDAAWHFEQESGRITFTGKNGVVATAAAQIVGSYDTADGTWLWAWDNPSVLPKLTSDSVAAREYGEANGVADLTTPLLHTSEEKCWELAAVACELAGEQGVYRGPSGTGRFFIAFGPLRLSKSQSPTTR